jgi:hypothetical protein
MTPREMETEQRTIWHQAGVAFLAQVTAWYQGHEGGPAPVRTQEHV